MNKLPYGLAVGFSSLGLVFAIACSTGGPCATNADCGSGQMCVFEIGSCSAKGQCVGRPSGPQCNAIEELCGCNGQNVITGCGFPSGFASGATTGASFCAADAGSDASNDVAQKSDAPSTDAAKNDASPALVTQCQTLANKFAGLCSGDAPRPCLWNAYAELCQSGQTQLLIDSMNCLDQTTCRTFSDPNEGEACLDSTHASEEPIASQSFITQTCAACNQTNCAAGVGVAEIIPYLTDADVAALASCRGNACDLNTLVQNCAATIPDVALFLSCTQ